MVIRRCRRLLRDDAEALDASQDVFVRLVERRERLNGEYPSSLLFRMATNVCLNRLRDRARRPEGHRAHDAGGAEEETVLMKIAAAETPVALTEARMTLERLFGRHPESSRTMAVLHYVDGMTLDDRSTSRPARGIQSASSSNAGPSTK
ncbi:MAG: hypothetical protein AMXMBFR57_00370 [Acidimicrobiia bacterium]